MTRSIPKPEPGEYPGYAKIYLDRLPDDDRLLDHLAAGLESTTRLVRGLSEAQLASAYAPGKWTIKEVYRGLPEPALLRSGEADGKRATVRALGWHMAGHEAHHTAIVRERYLGGR